MTIRLDAAGYDRRWNLVGAGRGYGAHLSASLQSSSKFVGNIGQSFWFGGYHFWSVCTCVANCWPLRLRIPISSFKTQLLQPLPSAIPPFQIQCKYGKRNLSGHGMACPSPFGKFSFSIATLPLSFIELARGRLRGQSSSYSSHSSISLAVKNI